MIKLKQIPLVNGKEKAMNELNDWKVGISLSDSNIQNVYFTKDYLECIYTECMKEELKYPKQCGSVGRGKKKGSGKIFSMEAELAATEFGTSPLEMHAGYSRYVATIIDKTEETKKLYHKAVICPAANIPVGDLDSIVIRTNTSVKMRIMQEMGILNTGSQAVGNSSAYTQKIMIGALKGKTPAQILRETPNAQKQLLETAKWLKQNLNQYSANKAQYDAIMDAVEREKAGTLDKTSTGINSIIPIYVPENKPFRKKVRKDGKTLIYGLSISCDIKKRMPYMISIENYYAPVIENEDKTLNIISSEMDGKEKSSINLSEKEWLEMLGKMDRLRNHYEQMMTQEVFRRVSNASYNNSRR